MKRVHVHYFAQLREKRGISKEWVDTNALTVGELVDELNDKHGFSLGQDQLKAARRADFIPMNAALEEEDRIALIPPVAGG